MALITDILLLVLTIGCATFSGHYALTEIEMNAERVLNNQQQILGEIKMLSDELDELEAAFTCHLTPCDDTGIVQPYGIEIKTFIHSEP